MYNYYSFDKYEPHTIEYVKYKRKTNISTSFIALDTETSHNHANEHKQSLGWVYQWAFAFDNDIVYGRKPSQLIQAFNSIIKYCNVSAFNKLVVFIHNAPYDFQYLKQLLIDEYGTPNILAYAPHKPFSIEFDNGLMIRCSYKLSNKSLDMWAKDLNTKHKKLVGAIDYDIIRYQDTKLTRRDWRYMFYDVIVLQECIKQQLLNYNDTISTMPLTSTGYVRREILNEFKKDNRNYVAFKKAELTPECYNMYRREFSGGITHGNRFLADETIKGVIRHRDFVSHYPSQQRTQLFPMGKTSVYYNIKNAVDRIKLTDVFSLAKKYVVTVQLLIIDLKLKSDDITLPYAQESKFRYDIERGTKFVCDNGRILTMTGKSRVVFNDIDLKWIVKQYNFKYLIEKVIICPKKPLPDFMLKVIDEHFKGKSDFKDIEKELEHNHAPIEQIRDAHTHLVKSKNVVNGIYGCSATDPVRDDIELIDGIEWATRKQDSNSIADKLTEYYNSRKHFMRYEWGCQTTAYARDELMTFVELIGYDAFIYADTDSIFYISTPEIEKRIDEYNNMLLQDSENKKAYVVNNKGKKIYYNQFDDENENISMFRFLHAKCYGYVCDNELKCVIAGVPSISDGVTREQELKTIDNLTNKFTFRKCGGTTIFYNEKTYTTDLINGHTIECGASAIIEQTTKTLNIDIDRVIFVYMEL